MTPGRCEVLLVAFALLEGCSASGPSSRSWEETGGPNARNISIVLADSRIVVCFDRRGRNRRIDL